MTAFSTSKVLNTLRPALTPATIYEIHQHSSLGLHVAILAKLSNGHDYAFTEHYPNFMFPVNTGFATSLHDVARLGGPKLAVHEVPLTIQGTTSLSEVRAIRRLRGDVPELASIQLTKDKVIVSLHNNFGLCHDRIRHYLEKSVQEIFKRQLYIDEPTSIAIPQIDDSDRESLRLLSHYSWKEPAQDAHQAHKKHSSSRCKKQHANHYKERDNHSIIIDLTQNYGVIICSGDKKGINSNQRCESKKHNISLSITREIDGEHYWRDLLRAVEGPPKTDIEGPAIRSIEKMHAHLHGNQLQLTILAPSSLANDSRIFRSCNGASQIKIIETRVASHDDLTRCLFDAVPHSGGLQKIITSPDGRKAFVHLSYANSQHRADFLRDLNRPDEINIYFDDSRLVPLPINDPRIEKIISPIPTGVGIRSIEACRCSEEIVIRSVRAISQDILAGIAREIGAPVSQRSPNAQNQPDILKIPIRYISEAPKLARTLSTNDANSLQTFIALGAAEGIGGSCYFLGNEIVLDHGGWIGEPDRTHNLIADGRALPKILVVTHAHHDHVANLIKLFANLPDTGSSANIQVAMHEATALAMWPLLTELKKRKESHFKDTVLKRLYKQIRLIPLHLPVKLSPNCTLRLIPAGHHLGSTMTLFEHTGPDCKRKILYTGDIKSGADLGNSRLYPTADLVPDLDALIIEGTNGIADSARREQLESELFDEIIKTIKEGGNVILPVLAGGRAQEVLTILRKNREILKALNVPVYVEGTSIKSFNDIFSHLSSAYPELTTIHEQGMQGWQTLSDDLFKSGIATRSLEDKTDQQPKIVVVSGGMGHGPARDFILAIKNNPNDKVIFTCFQPENRLGGRLLSRTEDRAKHQDLSYFKAQAVSRRLSGHNSGSETIEYIDKTVKDRGTVVLVHGSLDGLGALQEKISKQRPDLRVIVAKTDEKISLW